MTKRKMYFFPQDKIMFCMQVGVCRTKVIRAWWSLLAPPVGLNLNQTMHSNLTSNRKRGQCRPVIGGGRLCAEHKINKSFSVSILHSKQHSFVLCGIFFEVLFQSRLSHLLSIRRWVHGTHVVVRTLICHLLRCIYESDGLSQLSVWRILNNRRLFDVGGLSVDGFFFLE